MISKIEIDTDFDERKIKNNIIALPLSKKNQKEEGASSDNITEESTEKKLSLTRKYYVKEKLIKIGFRCSKKICAFKQRISQWRANHPLISLLLLWAVAGFFGILIGGLAGVSLRTSLCDSTVF